MRPLIEAVEPRRLMHAAFDAAINFAPESAPRSPGLYKDYGSVYGQRRDGLSYGWTSDQTDQTVYNAVSRSRKNNGFVRLASGATWEIAVPNGQYTVYAVGGDLTARSERIGVLAEGQTLLAGRTNNRTKPFVEGSAVVNVTDGRLSIRGAGAFGQDKINYLAITSSHDGGEDLPTVGITAIAPTAREEGQVRATVRLQRSTAAGALTVSLGVAGTATNGVDYGRIGRQVTFIDGVSTIDLKIGPVADGIDEADETVLVGIDAAPGYAITDKLATVTIQDAPATPTPTPTPTPTDGNITWTTGTAIPVATSEIISAEVGGKLYTFGGFIDFTFKPTKSARVYDPATGNWSSIAPLSVGLTHAGVAADDTTIYFAGGYPGNGPDGNQTFGTTHAFKYTPSTNTYTDLPNLPVARASGALAKLGNVLYYISGSQVTNRSDVTNVYALDLTNLAAGWVTKASLPAPRNHAGAVTLNGAIYVVGGQTGNDETLIAQSSLYRYNVAANTWTTLAAMPTGGRSHITDSTFVRNGRIVVLAGQNAYEKSLSSNLEYNPETNTWRTLNALPAARFSGAGHLLGNGKVIYTGGYNGGYKNNTYVGTFA